MTDLRHQIIERIMNIKNGMPGCTPQPDCAREELKFFNALLPWLELNEGVKLAMKDAA